MTKKQLGKVIAMGDAVALETAIEENPELLTKPYSKDEWLIHDVLESGNVELLKAVLRHHPRLDVISSYGMLPLTHAAHTGNVDACRLLIQAGADMYAKDRLHSDAMERAVRGGKPQHLEVIRLLVSLGYDLNPSDDGGSPLISTCFYNRLDIAELLISLGADVNHLAPSGTCLHIAVQEENTDFVKFLLARGARTNVLVPDEEDEFFGMTPLQIANKEKLKKIATLLKNGVAPVTEISWSAFVEELAGTKIGKKIRLRKPATAKQIQSVVENFNLAIPDAFLEYLRSANGETDQSIGLILAPSTLDDRYSLLCVRDIIACTNTQIEMMNSPEFASSSLTSDAQVRSVWWSNAWIPFATNGGGDFFCLDLDPSKKGQVGQVILFRHDSSHRRYIAESFGHFLRNLLEQ